jgi:hypothetical protein
MAAAKSETLRAFVTKPVTPCSTSSWGPPTSETMTGKPDRCASMMRCRRCPVVLGRRRLSAAGVGSSEILAAKVAGEECAGTKIRERFGLRAVPYDDLAAAAACGA